MTNYEEITAVEEEIDEHLKAIGKIVESTNLEFLGVLVSPVPVYMYHVNLEKGLIPKARIGAVLKSHLEHLRR